MYSADAAGADAVGAALTYANVLGGEGTAGAFAVKNAAPDGRSFLVGNKGAITSYPHTDPESYQPGDFAALGQFAEAPIAIAVARPAAPTKRSPTCSTRRGKNPAAWLSRRRIRNIPSTWRSPNSPNAKACGSLS